MTDAWFKPKAYGYRRAATLALVAVILVGSLVLLGWQLDRASGPAIWQIAALSISMAVSTGACVELCRAKTDGQWAWRWGK